MNPSIEFTFGERVVDVALAPARAGVWALQAFMATLLSVCGAAAVVAFYVAGRMDPADVPRLRKDMAYWFLREEPGYDIPEVVQPMIDVVAQWAKFTNYWYLLPIMLVLSMVVFRRSFKRTVMHLRGIHFESMQVGSDFTDGEIPDFQVGIYNAGTFVDTFVGYGVRFGAILAVPSHVVRHAPMLVIEGKTGKMGISVAPVQSRIHTDITYYPLTEAQWSRLGVSNSRVPKKVINALVSCTGKKGTTSGLLSRIEALGILKYAGSTVGGMSGAAYYSGQTVHGMHTGSTGAFNVGVSSLLIMAEVKKLVIGETPTLEEMRGLNRASAAKVKAGWDTDGLMKQIDEIYSRDCEWAEEHDIDYGAQLDFESGEEYNISERWLMEFMKLPSAQQQSAVVALQSLINSGRTVKGQSDHDDSVMLPKDFVSARFDMVEKRLDELEDFRNRVEKAGVQTPKVKQPNPGALQMDSPLPYLCGFEGKDENGAWRCRKGFTTEAARLQHQIVKGHVAIAGESAFAGDLKVPVATRPVFPKRLRSPNRNTKNWSSISNTVVPPIPSTSQTPSQSSTQVLPEQILKNLVESLQGMVGQVLATMPNSKV